MEDLTAFQRDVLYVIAGLDEPYGLAIKDELEEYYDKEIHHGRLSPNLDTLVEKGLVKKGQYDNRTNSYSLTQRGRRDIEARREWEDQYTSVTGRGEVALRSCINECNQLHSYFTILRDPQSGQATV